MQIGSQGVVGGGEKLVKALAAQEVPQASKTTWTLDAAKRYSASTTAAWDAATGAWGAATTSRNAYDGDGDRPAWTIENIDTPTNVTRYVDGPDGNLVMTTGKSGGRKLLLTDLHGDTLATVPIADGSSAATWSSLRFTANDEYGNPLALSSSAEGTSRYSWHATAQRAFTTGLGAVLMGARPYLPYTGTFTTIDPVPGGNTTAYAYPQDPINSQDLDGQWKKWLNKKKAQVVAWGAKQLFKPRNITIISGKAYVVMRKGRPGIHWGGAGGHANRIEYDSKNKWHYNPAGSKAHLSVREGFRALAKTNMRLVARGASIVGNRVAGVGRALARGGSGFFPIVVPGEQVMQSACRGGLVQYCPGGGPSA